MKKKDSYVIELNSMKARARKVDYLSCRRGALSHAWQAVQPDFDSPVKGGRAVARQCTRCLAIVRSVVDKKFGEYLSGPHYEYPEGYLDKRGKGQRALSSHSVRAVFAEIYGKADNLPEIEQLS